MQQPAVEETASSSAAAAEEPKDAAGDLGGEAGKTSAISADTKWTAPAPYVSKGSEAGAVDKATKGGPMMGAGSSAGSGVSDSVGKTWRPSEAIQPVQTYEDAKRVLQALEQMSNSVAFAEEQNDDVEESKPAEAAKTSANSADKRWTAPAGYVPKRSEAGKETMAKPKVQPSDDERPSVQLRAAKPAPVEPSADKTTRRAVFTSEQYKAWKSGFEANVDKTQSLNEPMQTKAKTPVPKVTAKPWTPPAGYAPKKSEVAKVRQPKVDEAAPSSLKTGAEDNNKAKPEVSTMDAGSSGGSSLSASAQGKEPQPSASDPTRYRCR